MKIPFNYKPRLVGPWVLRRPARRRADRALLDLLDPFASPLARPPLPAARTEAGELEPMAREHEPQEAGDSLLLRFQRLAVELHDLAAALADDVVVVLGALLARLVARLAVVEAPLGGESRFLEQLE